MVAWNMYNIYSTVKDAKSFAKKPTLGGGIMVAAGVTPVGKVNKSKKILLRAGEKIAGYKITLHAAKQMKKYSNSKKELETALKYGEKYKSTLLKYQGRTIHYLSKNKFTAITKKNKIISAHGKWTIRSHWRKY